jgi:hypothetical protein
MSSWLLTPRKKIAPNPTLSIRHPNNGFFSTCSIILHYTVEYFNHYRKLPETIDTSDAFNWYRPGCLESFFTLDINKKISYRNPILYEHFHQYTDYMKLDYAGVKPFLQKYFTPSEEVQGLIKDLEAKYQINYQNTCVLFYRGNDKATETALPSYADYIKRARAILQERPQTRFLVQSDETEFIETMVAEFGEKAVWFKDEIRHIPKAMTTVDIVCDDAFKFSKFYLAITIVMSKCPYIICGSGNCSIWIALFRGSAKGMQQFLKSSWIVGA